MEGSKEKQKDLIGRPEKPLSAKPRVLLLNPWIHDFSAFDFWMRPLSLYRLASVLRDAGFEVGIYDCLNRHHPGVLERKGRHQRDKEYGCGHYYREVIEKPACLSFVPRNYRRFGVPIDVVAADFSSLEEPDAVIVACTMTYWYPGAFEMIRLCRRTWPGVPGYLGGVYADLLPDHAREHSGAHRVFSRESFTEVTRQVALDLDLPRVERPEEEGAGRSYIRPAYDLAWTQRSLPVVTSRGCPYRCTYCVSPVVNPVFEQFPPEEVAGGIVDCVNRFGTGDFAFYDDALLAGGADHFAAIMEGVLGAGVRPRFHLPNAIHAGLVTREVTALMRRAGFKTIRLGLEFADPERQKSTGGKVRSGEYERSVDCLREAGFTAGEIGTYVMLGYPGQGIAEVREAARVVHAAGSHVRLVMYAPIPGSTDWGKGFDELVIDPREDPLLTNNSLAPYRSRLYTSHEYVELKREINAANEVLLRG
jgi:radical SAM superfamily enzyme YgiQ (UPF0313 family)